MVGDEPELGEQRADVAGVHPSGVLERAQQRRRPVEPVARLLDLADDHARTDRASPGDQLGAAQQHVDQRRLARAIGADECDPLAGTDEEVDRAQLERAAAGDGAVETGDDVAAASRRRHLQPQLPRLPRLVDGLQPLHRPLGARRPTGELLGLVDLEGADVLVRLVGLARLGQPLRRPLPLALGAPSERAPLRVVVLEALPRRPPGRLAFVEVRLPATAVVRRPVGELVELDDVGDGPGEERAVVADEHDRRGAAR